jgi:hypothetical protein
MLFLLKIISIRLNTMEEQTHVNTIDTSDKNTSPASKEKTDYLNGAVSILVGLKGAHLNTATGEAALSQLMGICSPSIGRENALMETVSSLAAIAPQDRIEGMLATQMLATHHSALQCLKRAAVQKNSEFADKYFNQANKLMRTFTTQIEVLNKYRGKGQQKMTVEHVHVHSGGKAIVGCVETSHPHHKSIEEAGGVTRGDLKNG